MNAPIDRGVRSDARLAPRIREALPSLCAALGLESRAAEVAGLFDRKEESWTGLSFEIGAHESEVRLVGEAAADAGRTLTRRLAEQHGLALEPLARIEELFDGSPLRYAAVLRGSAPARFEIFLDAQARGRWRTAAVVEEALFRLGFDRAWPSLAEHALRRGQYVDEVRYLSIELAPPGDGRAPVRVYVQHHDASLSDVRAALGDSALAARAEELCLALAGSLGPYRAPLVTAHAFAEAGAAKPSFRALHVPVAAYGATDAVTRGRVSAYLALQGLSSDGFEQALAAYAAGPLAARAGLQRYVGLREDASSVTVELAAPDAPAPVIRSASEPLPPPDQITRRFENDIILADHPFMQRVAREPLVIGRIWLVAANLWRGIVHDFPKQIARVIAKIDDDRIRCILTKQLNDELGEGSFDRAHKAMYRAYLGALEPYRLEGPDDVILAPGLAFAQELWGDLEHEDQYVTLGKMMMIETYGEQTDRFMGVQLRRQNQLDTASLKWLHLHEGLEIDHAKDSLTLSHCVPQDPAAIASVWRGAEAIVTAGRHFFDALYRISFA